MKDIAIIGAGGLGREVLVLLHQINEVRPTWNVIGFYDDDTAYHGQTIDGVSCHGAVGLLAYFPDELYLVLAVGLPAARAAVSRRVQNPNARYATLVHPLAQPRPYQQISLAEGVLIFQGAVLSTNIRLGRHTLVYPNCTIGHDATIGDFSTLMPGATLSGNTCLGEGILIGANAVVLPHLSIGEGSQVGAGAVITTALPARCTAAGIPAKISNQHEL
ncbi:acetyltransferase [Pontibacter liquoris]|uniref:acetyltransferase n=1 Tax=Pontibacter liquoris TaxID=2905677 RepID=UPI001FA72603|nr:acetyltransferase [Pontibacter liquoris]